MKPPADTSRAMETRVVLIAFLIRFTIFTLVPEIPRNLENSIQLSTLTNSFRSLKEGVFLLQNGMDLYDGGVVHVQPLLVAVAQYVLRYSDFLYSIIDSAIVYLFIRISKKNPIRAAKPDFFDHWFVGLAYCINPIAILSTLGKSTVIFTNLFILLSVDCMLSQQTTMSFVFISVAGYLAYHPIFLVVPLLKMVYSQSAGGTPALLAVVVKNLLIAAATLAGLLFASYRINSNSWDFLYHTFGTIVKFDKIAPNVGLWWYFFTEMFEFFIPFYNVVFNLYSVVFVTPLTLRLHDGLVAFILGLGWLDFSKSYPTLSDLAVYLTFILLFKPVCGYLKLALISFLLIVNSIVLSPIFYHLWIDLGSGNSNFYYALTLSYSLGIAATIADFTWAFLRFEYDGFVPNPQAKLGQI